VNFGPQTKKLMLTHPTVLFGRLFRPLRGCCPVKFLW